MNGARVKLMELREYVSERSGKTYFSGFLGKAKVVVLRDERAECTGREKARWSVLLEEQEPRKGDRSPSPVSAERADPDQPVKAPKSFTRAALAKMGRAPDARATAADKAAGRLLRESGIDPESEMSRDEIPF